MNEYCKALKLLRLAQRLSATAPRRWTARELSTELGLGLRSVYRYLGQLDPILPVCQEGNRYWVERPFFRTG